MYCHTDIYAITQRRFTSKPNLEEAHRGEKHEHLYNNQIVKLICVFRIVDNMPVTWCYDVEEGQKFCNPGFPIGCYVTETGQPKDACVVNVSGLKVGVNMKMLAFNNYVFCSHNF